MSQKKFLILSTLLISLLALATVLSTLTATAAPTTITVDTLIDEDNTCGMGSCSLREAIAEAVPGDTIDFSVSGIIDISGNGELVVNKSLTIQSTQPITISGGNATRVFNLTAGNITFDGLTIANGNVQTNDCGSDSGQCGGGIVIQNSSVELNVNNSTISGNTASKGGGIYNEAGTLTVDNSILSGNSATVTSGGGIHTRDGTMIVTESILSDNSATTHGGGIYNYGDTLMITDSVIIDNSADYGGGLSNALAEEATINNSTLSGNTATHGGGIFNMSKLTVTNSYLTGNVAGYGGGINNVYNLTVDNSTFSGNLASYGSGVYNENNLTINHSTFSDNLGSYGGGIYNEDGTAIVTNSTFSGNSIYFEGGGINNTSGTLTVGNSTFSGNSASNGSGIYNDGGDFTLRNTILANSVGGEDCYSNAALADDEHNLIESNSGCGIPVSSADPQLVPLADNGGSTLTHALPPSSPAFNAGDPDFTPPPEYDQRGSGYPRVFDGRIDIGAFEYSPPLNEIYLPILVAPGNP